MNYQNYEEYMRSVLGYVPNTYTSDNMTNYMPEQTIQTVQENVELYPEIYKIIYPMVQKACNDAQNQDVTRDLVENVTNIIYTNIEVGDTEVNQTVQQPELRNGDVINPRAKMQPQRETRSPRPNNPLLRDLIRILVLREFFDRRRPPQIPPFSGRPGPRPPFGPNNPPRIY